jgi:hypothetical protein
VRLPDYRGPLMALLLGPGRISNDVDYRCDECGAKELRSVPRAGRR